MIACVDGYLQSPDERGGGNGKDGRETAMRTWIVAVGVLASLAGLGGTAGTGIVGFPAIGHGMAPREAAAEPGGGAPQRRQDAGDRRAGLDALVRAPGGYSPSRLADLPGRALLFQALHALQAAGRTGGAAPRRDDAHKPAPRRERVRRRGGYDVMRFQPERTAAFIFSQVDTPLLP